MSFASNANVTDRRHGASPPAVPICAVPDMMVLGDD